MELRVKLGVLDDKLYELREYDSMEEIDEIIIFRDEEAMMTVESMVIKVPELQLQLRCGTMYLYSEEEGEYMADWSLTAVYKEGAMPEEYLFYTQDSPLIAVYNCFKGGKTMDEVEGLDCQILL